MDKSLKIVEMLTRALRLMACRLVGLGINVNKRGWWFFWS